MMEILPIVSLHSHDETLIYIIILTKSNIFQVLKDFFIVPEGVLLMRGYIECSFFWTKKVEYMDFIGHDYLLTKIIMLKIWLTEFDYHHI